MRQLKNKLDLYFDLQGDIEGQLLYYGLLGLMLFAMVGGTLGGLIK
ncbi:hypothetical protein AAXB25_14790 [Paenibacillus lautus]